MRERPCSDDAIHQLLAWLCVDVASALPTVKETCASAKMFCDKIGPHAIEKFFVNDSENFRNGDPRQTLQVWVAVADCGNGKGDETGGSVEMFELAGL